MVRFRQVYRLGKERVDSDGGLPALQLAEAIVGEPHLCRLFAVEQAAALIGTDDRVLGAAGYG